jgi:hypothetical protein
LLGSTTILFTRPRLFAQNESRRFAPGFTRELNVASTPNLWGKRSKPHPVFRPAPRAALPIATCSRPNSGARLVAARIDALREFIGANCSARNRRSCAAISLRSHERSAEVGVVRFRVESRIGCVAPQGTDFDDYLKM